MIKVNALVIGVGIALAGASSAWAASGQPVQPPSAAGIELVSGGCGPGGHRGAYGECRPNMPPRVYRCPYGTHPTPYGCRRNY